LETDTFVREKCPVREIATLWEVEKLEEFLGRHELLPVITKSLHYYAGYLVNRDGYMILDPIRLEEPSSIAHSAFMILSLLHAPAPRDVERITALSEGILRQQRPDGSYKVYFDDIPDQGEELYGGEAMLALLESYRQLKDTRYLSSVQHACLYYDRQYFQQGRVTDDVLVFFVNWQSQACRLLFECSHSNRIKKFASDHLFRMHDRIIESGFYEGVRESAAAQVSVEVASALEGLNDMYAVISRSGDERIFRYHKYICVSLEYLLKMQCIQDGNEKEKGGFGLSLNGRPQRIDVTGHAASAFMKTVENRIECRGVPHE